MVMLSSTWFHTDIEVRNRSGVDEWSDFSFSAAYTLKARVEHRRELIRSFSGEYIESSHIIYTREKIPEHAIVFVDGSDSGVLNNGFEVYAYWETKRMDGGETLFKTWLTFFK